MSPTLNVRLLAEHMRAHLLGVGAVAAGLEQDTDERFEHGLDYLLLCSALNFEQARTQKAIEHIVCCSLWLDHALHGCATREYLLKAPWRELHAETERRWQAQLAEMGRLARSEGERKH